MRCLYDEAAYREERYAALALLAVRAARSWHDVGLVPLVEHLVVRGAWWDLVDEIAGRTGRSPAPRRPRRHGAGDPPLVAPRRPVAAAYGGAQPARQQGLHTDRALLAEVVDATAGSSEFFLRKAIGWALRDLAHHDPAWVRAFLADRGARLSPLSRREAAKHL